MFYKAIDWEIYECLNPVRKVRFYQENHRREALTEKSLEKVMKASSKEIQRAPQSPLQKVFSDLVLIALNTGMRKSEILNLRWGDMKGREIEV